MNIEDPSARRLCTSCQLCSAVCPTGAITFALNEEGFYRPSVNPETCINCSLCVKSCYKFINPAVTSPEEMEKMPIYAASSKSADVLEHTSSGGVADVLARHLVEKGWLCVGVEYDSEHNDARHIPATTVEKATRFRGSKYIQSYSEKAFKEVLKNHLNDKVAVFGTPCQIFGIDLVLRRKNKRENFLLVDIFCHGCPTLNLWKKYVAEIRQKSPCKHLNHINFRSKARGWGNFTIEAENDGKTVYISKKRNDPFFSLFFSDEVLNDACSDCIVRGTLEYTDIRLGDFWGHLYETDTKGVSIVTCATGRGEKAWQQISKEFETSVHKPSDFLPFQSYGKAYHPNQPLRRQLLKSLADKEAPLSEAVVLYHKSQPFTLKIKRLLRNGVSFLPLSMLNRIKQIYHSKKA